MLLITFFVLNEVILHILNIGILGIKIANMISLIVLFEIGSYALDARKIILLISIKYSKCFNNYDICNN